MIAGREVNSETIFGCLVCSLDRRATCRRSHEVTALAGVDAKNGSNCEDGDDDKHWKAVVIAAGARVAGSVVAEARHSRC